MKSILCYGDSNTWGYVPITGARYDENTRWPRIMASQLGGDFHVIEEGLNARTTAYEDPLAEYRNGMETIVPCILTHAPLDLVLIMLGTNDMKEHLCCSARCSAGGVGQLIDRVRRYPECGNPKILMIAPIHISPEVERLLPFATFIGQGPHEESLRFAEEYARIAKDKKVHFFNAAAVAEYSPGDGLHMDPAGHKALGEALAEKVQAILG